MMNGFYLNDRSIYKEIERTEAAKVLSAQRSIITEIKADENLTITISRYNEY